MRCRALVLLGTSVACATPRSARAPDPATPAFVRAAAAQTAAGLVGTRGASLGDVRTAPDCSGFVRLVYAVHGVDLFALGADPRGGGVGVLYAYARARGEVHRGPPRPGDVAFFRDTYDRNRDGRVNDGLTHVGIVERVEPDGTVSVIHRVERGIVRYRMNPAHASARMRGGRVINDFLRRGNDGRPRLAGELFAAYATVVR